MQGRTAFASSGVQSRTTRAQAFASRTPIFSVRPSKPCRASNNVQCVVAAAPGSTKLPTTHLESSKKALEQLKDSAVNRYASDKKSSIIRYIFISVCYKVGYDTTLAKSQYVDMN